MIVKHTLLNEKCKNLIIRSYIICDPAPTNDNKNHAIARNKCRKTIIITSYIFICDHTNQEIVKTTLLSEINAKN